MAVTQSILCGMTVTLQTNVVYALPGIKSVLFTDSAAPTLEQSNDITFATKVPVVLTNGMANLAAAFIRATSGTPTIRLSED